MHYLLLGIGVILGVYGLYRFFINANLKQITALFMVAGFIIICAALFYLAVTGRLPAALGLLAALWPIALSIWHRKRRAQQGHDGQSQDYDTPPAAGPMTRREALEILGLAEGASTKEIRDSYNRLIKKVHPDQEGSQWLAAKLNQAKDILLD